MDISNELRNQNYTNVLPNNFFYVWVSNTNGGQGEMSFATSTTNYSPSLVPTEVNPWKYLVNNLTWFNSGLFIVTVVDGSSAGSAEVPGGGFGNGDGGITSGTSGTNINLYNASPLFPIPVGSSGKWEQNNGSTTKEGTASPYGDVWPSVAINQAKLYKVTLHANGGFIFEEITSICYHRDSKVLILNKQARKSEEKKVRDISETDMVYSITRKKYVPVRLNIITYKNTSYMLLKKNLFGPNKPNDDLYITKGHPILYKGKETPVEKIPGAKKVTCEEQEVYSIVTDIREYIIVNGVETMTWSYNGWRNAYLNGSHKILWENTNDNHVFDNIKVEMVGDENIKPKNIKVCKNAFGNNIPNEDMMVNENYELIIDDMTTKTKIREMVNGVTVILLE